MFCPKCKMEYNPGIQKCADCGVDLVYALPEVPHSLEHEYLYCVETMNLSDIAFIESALKGSGIEYRLVGEHFKLMGPIAEPVRFYVREDQVEDAKELIKTMDLRYMAFTQPDTEMPDDDLA